jgi:hypothetical protein
MNVCFFVCIFHHALRAWSKTLTRNTKQRLRVHFDQYLLDKEINAVATKARSSAHTKMKGLLSQSSSLTQLFFVRFTSML